jgi:hypothetical protein
MSGASGHSGSVCLAFDQFQKIKTKKQTNKKTKKKLRVVSC